MPEGRVSGHGDPRAALASSSPRAEQVFPAIPSPWNAEGACPSLQRQLKMVLLVPELTFLTGLSDLRKNSRMLKVRARLVPCSRFSRGLGSPP